MMDAILFTACIKKCFRTLVLVEQKTTIPFQSNVIKCENEFSYFSLKGKTRKMKSSYIHCWFLILFSNIVRTYETSRSQLAIEMQVLFLAIIQCVVHCSGNMIAVERLLALCILSLKKTLHSVRALVILIIISFKFHTRSCTFRIRGRK